LPGDVQQVFFGPERQEILIIQHPNRQNVPEGGNALNCFREIKFTGKQISLILGEFF